MSDSLAEATHLSVGIPDIGTRITLLVVVTFALTVSIAILYIKMKESDEHDAMK